MAVIENQSGYAAAGAAFRYRISGPEDELVERFLGSEPFRLPKDCRLTIFREPSLESGYPDLVAVIWKPSVTVGWNATRADLTSIDLRLMQYVFHQGPTNESVLRSVFSNKVTTSLERLNAAQMLRRSKGKWKAPPIRTCFAVNSIIAIEAKITDWKTALQQAATNTWFASLSYVLLPRLPKRLDLVSMANKLGVGVWALDERLIEHRSTLPERLPRSYASWLFNEWAWRTSELNGD